MAARSSEGWPEPSSFLIFPVRNFISLATIRRGSMVGRSPLPVRAIALETMLPATETAAAHAEGLGRPEWKRALG